MDKHEAAVVGSSLVSFLPDITASQRQSVLLALLMSERVAQTDSQLERKGDWYTHYRRRLQYLGWDALTAEQVHWPSAQRRSIVEGALQTVRQVGGERHASSLSEALPGLLRSSAPLRHLERRSSEWGSFQLIPCAAGKPGFVDVVLYHEAGKRELFTPGFLNLRLESTSIRAELVRFNVRLFQQEHEAIVRKRVSHMMQQEILSFEV